METQILGRCRRCGADFPLSYLAELATGLCPHCGWLLSPDWVPLLLEEAARADRAHGELIEALRRLSILPGNLEILPHSVLAPLLEEVDWTDQLQGEPKLVSQELWYLREAFADWEALTEHERAERLGGLTARAHQIAQRLRRLGRTLDARHELESSGDAHDGQALRSAANRLETAVSDLGQGGSGAEIQKRVQGVESAAADALKAQPRSRQQETGPSA